MEELPVKSIEEFDSEDPKTKALLMELEFEKFALEKEKHLLEKVANKSDSQRANNDSLMQLLGIVKYLNDLRDEKIQEVDEGFTKTTYTSKARSLDPLEEDLANCCLKSMAAIVCEIGNAKINKVEVEAEIERLKQGDGVWPDYSRDFPPFEKGDLIRVNQMTASDSDRRKCVGLELGRTYEVYSVERSVLNASGWDVTIDGFHNIESFDAYWFLKV